MGWLETKITATSSVEWIGTFERAGLQVLSSNKHNTLETFLNQPQTAYFNIWLQ